MKKLVLAEKPSVAKDIARIFKCEKKGDGFFEGQTYVVTWALGHLVTLADPEMYDSKYKSWWLEDLPMLPDPLKLVVIPKSRRQFHHVKQQMLRKDIREIVIATDAGREGELVARWIIQKVRVKKPLKRLWISSVTDRAIREGFRRLKDASAYNDLFASAQARAKADWYVGLNASRALTTKFQAQLSCGRVQTPTLAMVAQREEEIRRFRPRAFYGIRARTISKIELIWHDAKTGKDHTFDRQKRDRILEKLQNKEARVVRIEKKRNRRRPPGLYDLTEIQQEANRRFGFSAKDTLSMMQRLYETHKLITYPRTDSKFLSRDIIPTVADRVRACSVGPYAKAAECVLKKGFQLNRSFVNDSKVSDHHAVIPTEEQLHLDRLSDREQKIYDLIVRRFLAAFFPPYEYERTQIQVDIGGETFRAAGYRPLKKGWKAVYSGTNTEEAENGMQTLPAVREGESLGIPTFSAAEGKTSPPERFTEGTLLKAMENPAKWMGGEDKKLQETLNRAGGIGTVATRADIIEKLHDHFMIEKKGPFLTITSKGRQLLELVPEELRSPALTARWEQRLEAIACGKLNQNRFLREIKEYTATIVREIKQDERHFKHDNMTGTRCPECDDLLLKVKNKKGTLLVCRNSECRYRKNVAKKTNARCPQCHKKMELRGEGEGKIFVCRCGFKEKWVQFQKRKDKQKQQTASRRDLQKYLKKGGHESELANPQLAEALKRLKDRL